MRSTMVKNEIHSITHNPLLIIVLLAIMLIPSIYAGFFLNSMWDPYGDLKYLPVAVVNNDKSYTYEDTELTVGDDLCDELKDNDSMAFNIVDADTAEQGLENGTYYMVITIPENFSKNAASVMDDDPQQMELDCETNPGKNYIATKMTESAIKQIKTSLIEEVTRTYTETVFDRLVDVADGFDDATDGTQEMLDGEDELIEGNDKITTNLKTLAASCLTFKEGGETLATGLDTYTSGVSTLNDGIGQLKTGVDTMSTSATSGILQLTKGANTLRKGINSYAGGVSQIASGSATLSANSKALNKGVKTVSNGTKQLASGSAKLLAGLTTIQTSINASITPSSEASIKLAAASLPQLDAGIQQLNSKLNGASGDAGLDTSSLDQVFASVKKDLVNASGDLGNTGADIVKAGNYATAAGKNIASAGASTKAAGANVTSAGTKLKKVASGDLTNAITLASNNLATDYTVYATAKATSDTAKMATAAAAVKNDLTMLNYLYGTDNLTAVLKAKSLYTTEVAGILSSLDKCDGVAGSLTSIGTDLTSAGVNLNSVGTDLTYAGDNLSNGVAKNLKQAGTDLTAAGNDVKSVGNTLTALSGSGLTDQLAELKTGVKQIATASSQLCTPSAKALTSLLVGMENIQTAFNKSANDASGDGTSGVIEGMTTLNNGILALQAGIDGKNGLKAGVKTYTAGVDQIAAGAKTLNANSPKLKKGAVSLYKGTKKLKSLSSGIDTVSKAVNKMLKGSTKLVNNNAKLMSGVNELSDGAGKISDGATKLHDGSEELGDGLVTLNDGTDELHDALADGAQEVKDNEATDENIDMFVSPVDYKETKITTVENNGHAMAAYMLTVGLWVGCLAFCLMYPLATYKGEFESGRRWWLSKALVLYPLSILQALVVLLVLKEFLGFEPQRWGETILVAIIVSETFMAIMYFFNVLMGKVGSFLMLIFMVLQLAGSAGTYPVEISGDMVAAIHKWVPFTYTVDAFRSAISGGASIAHEMTVLVVLLIVFTLATIVVFGIRGYCIKRGIKTVYEWIEEKGLA